MLNAACNDTKAVSRCEQNARLPPAGLVLEALERRERGEHLAVLAQRRLQQSKPCRGAACLQ